jgi:murein L,D-transpeptidase YcbB/YkuD
MGNPLTFFVTIRVLAALGLFLTLSLAGSSFASAATLLASQPGITTPPTIDDITGTVPASAPVEQVPQGQAESPTGKALMTAPISANLSGEDVMIAEKLREMLATTLAQHIGNKNDRVAVETFYRNRGFSPIWITNARANERAKNANSFLNGVDADALDPADYPTPAFASGTPETLAQDEIKLTNSVLTFARQARTGRVSFSKVSAAISYDLQAPIPVEVLAAMVESTDIGKTLDSYNPQQPGYKALKTELARQRGRSKDRPNAVPIRSTTIDTIIANMERWRWLPRDLGQAYVMVNIPDFTLRVVDHEKTAWSTRIVAGKPGKMSTPLLSETMKSITINPTWSVPPSIIRNEYLPALREDPDALTRIGLKVSRNDDGSIRIYQPPGERNALGRIRFNFPNKFLVYQHDTPNKELFAKNERAFSHGCMRVQNPEKYAEVLTSISQPTEALTADRVRRFFGTNERNINLKNPIPVHVTYQTAFVDETGTLQIRLDIYGRDTQTLKLLRNGHRSTDAHVARNDNTNNRRPVSTNRNRQERELSGLSGFFRQFGN